MFTGYGRRELLKYGILAAIASIFCILWSMLVWQPFLWLIWVPLAEYCFVMYFFRDPERIIPQEEGTLVSPADGTVTHIGECEDPGCLGQKALRISIFMSVFDVHVNRAAYKGRVISSKYKKGEFLNAMSDESLDKNECNDLTLETGDARMPRYGVRQIAGLIARRVVCVAKPGDELATGEKFGMMKFSSRADLFIPLETKVELRVKIGDKVAAGSSILAKLI